MHSQLNQESPRQAAISYARLGFPVFPVHWVSEGRCSCRNPHCGNNTAKHPLTPQGYKDATTDEDTIRLWWEANPQANIGLALGDSVVALDVDPRNGGNAYLMGLGRIPGTPSSKTGGGGWHYLFSATGQGLRNKQGLLPGIDLKAAGGYIVAPPSSHVSGGRYEWVVAPDEAALAPIPDDLIALISGDRTALASALVVPHWDQGRRHALCLSLSGFLAKAGVSQETCEDILQRITRLANDEEVDDRIRAVRDTYAKLDRGEEILGAAGLEEHLPDEVVKRLKKLWKPFPRNDSKDAEGLLGLRLTYDEILRLPPPSVQWLAEGFLPDLPVVAFASEPGAGKTWLGLSIALSISAGTPLFGVYPTRRARVLYLDAENPPREIHRRVVALSKGLGLPGSLPFVSRANVSLDVGVEEGVATLKDCIAADRPEVIILDSLIDFHSANENDAREMTKVMLNIRRIAGECNVRFVILHHFRKHSSQGGNKSITRFKGAVNIPGGTDVAFGLRGAAQGGIVIDVAKERVRTLKEPIKVALRDTDDGGVVIEFVGAGQNTSEDEVRVFVREFLADGMKTREEILAEARERKLCQRTVDDALRQMEKEKAGGLRGGKDGRRKTYELEE